MIDKPKTVREKIAERKAENAVKEKARRDAANKILQKPRKKR